MSELRLELTNNSKTSWAFSMPRSKTCVHATDACWAVCYGGGVRYQTEGSKRKRLRNYETIEFLLNKGGPELAAKNLIELIDKAKPAGWFMASVLGKRTAVPWTLRIHDVGDFYYRTDYVEAWKMAVEARDQCFFWFYTRSFRDRDLFEAMTKLASLGNCQGWLSIDSENYKEGIVAYARESQVWRLAFMQQEKDLDNDDLLVSLSGATGLREMVSFPVHRGKHHAKPIEEESVDGVLYNCPAVLGMYKLQGDSNKPRPCQVCTYCLPAGVSKVI